MKLTATIIHEQVEVPLPWVQLRHDVPRRGIWRLDFDAWSWCRERETRRFDCVVLRHWQLGPFRISATVDV